MITFGKNIDKCSSVYVQYRLLLGWFFYVQYINFFILFYFISQHDCFISYCSLIHMYSVQEVDISSQIHRSVVCFVYCMESWILYCPSQPRCLQFVQNLSAPLSAQQKIESLSFIGSQDNLLIEIFFCSEVII